MVQGESFGKERPRVSLVEHSGYELTMRTGAAAVPVTSAGILPASAEAQAGPSRAAPAKRKYEVNRADLEFCKKVGS